MARPTDPEKLAALRARQAANSARYRARKAAERNPEAAPGPRLRAAPATEAAVVRAHEARAAARAKRNEVVAGLTSARNPAVKIHTPREFPSAPAAIPDTAAKRRQRVKVIRANMDAQKLTNIGRRRKAELADIMGTDPRADAIRANLSSDQIARLQTAAGRMSSVSQQTLAIYFQYEGGEGELQSALTQMAYPRGSDIEDMLGRIESMADLVEQAETLYGPKAVGRLRI